MKYIALLFCIMLSITCKAQTKKPFRIGVAGLTHDHVRWLLGRVHDGDMEIVGIAEPNRELALRYLKEHNIPLSLLYPSLDEMLDKTKPEAVAAFNSIDEHLDVVKMCAPRGIHVMVEKPLAVNLEQAKEMEALAKKHDISLLTNYETTWYGSNNDAVKKLTGSGVVRKVVIHDGHQGPKEIGVSKEFLAWLTDPKKNGGGAITDFGCYGANLTTWLMHGERPLSVIAVTQQIKPELYPNVDDDATIILTYAKAQVIIQASWNWPFGRKDMEIYTERGYAIADRDSVEFRLSYESKPEFEKSSSLPTPYHDPFVYLAAVVRKEIKVSPNDLSALENNMLVMEILDAAKRSVKEKRVISFEKLK
jgi:predicted dehydrogenase